ncbi:MAG: hypothetical protein ABS84_03200 [Rubrivivax sp. SCN 71-131]|jgi:type IV pilus assembly protein PilW|nr:MAG: hypothetical protein ABS84_03200 [Rubrivivax sp. SCN 71-131]
MCAERSPCGAARARQRGLSIIELMVGLVVALLVGLAATSSAVMFGATQRQGMGVGGAAVNANTALAALKNDALTAGLGFFGDARFLCTKLNLSVGATTYMDGAAFAPVQITQVAGADRLDVMQSARVESGANVLLDQASNGSEAALMSYLPAIVGDAVLLSPENAADPCTVRSVTAVTASTVDDPQKLLFASGGTHNDGAFTTPPAYSDSGAGVTLLGSLRWQRYRLDSVNHNLVLERPLEGTDAVIARNVIGFRVQYGVSPTTLAQKTLESWVDATGTFAVLDAVNIPRVRAVRIGIVLRSPQREKEGPGGTCEASTAKPTLWGATVEPDVTDWQCYRYRKAEAVVPLRNLVLGIKT